MSAPYNPRIDLKPDGPRMLRLVESMDTHGNVQPGVWNRRTGHLVAGHQRKKVLEARGDTAMPCVVVDLPLADEKALNIRLNKSAGDWDHDKLTHLLNDLASNTQLDLTLTGFHPTDLDRLLTPPPEVLGTVTQVG